MATLSRRRPPGVPSGSPTESTTDDAWRTLTLIVEWIKHADAKATATLASAGVVGGLLYTLVNTATERSVALAFAAAACALALTATAAAAGIALLPRLGGRPAPTELIFYRGIADRYGTDADAFAADYAALVTDRPSFFAALTRQVWANAQVARRKYRALTVAVPALLAALLLLAVTAMVRLVSS